MNFRQLLFFLIISFSSKAQSSSDLNKFIWPGKTINVCWERSASAFKNEKIWVEEAIKDTWGKASGLEFACWCDCQSSSNGIRIAVDDIRPTTNGKLGKQLDKQSNGLVLNFTYKKTQIPIGIRNKYNIKELDFQNIKPKTEPERKRFIKATAVHEFGHALGLTHQNDRNDCSFSDCFFDGNDAVQGALWFTPCDEYSVMNYCSNAYLNDGYLSELDATAIRILYPYVKTPQNEPLYIKYTYDTKMVKNDTGQQQRQDNNRQYAILADNIVVYLGGTPQQLEKITNVTFRPHGTTLKEKTIVGPQKLYYQVYKGVWGSFTQRVDVTFNDGTSTVLTKEIDPKPPKNVEGKPKSDKVGNFFRSLFKRNKNKNGS